MRNYETIFVLKPNLEEEARNEMIEKFKSIIADAGEVESVEEWGIRRLAYEIDKIREGYYVLVRFRSNPELPKELERNYKIADEVMRYIVINLDEK
ncbi:MAG: 30S ribosomal protein S6 [Bacillota bacterium]|nr:30S ribosomal protein S6 [Bacillota bacterium]